MDIQSLSSVANNQNKLESAQQTPVNPIVKQQLSVASPDMESQKEIGKVTQEKLDNLNVKLEQLGMGLSFSVDENTQSSVIKVIDKTTDEIIKQYPSEGSLRVIKNIQEYLDSVQNSKGLNKDSLTGTLLSEII